MRQAFVKKKNYKEKSSYTLLNKTSTKVGKGFGLEVDGEKI